MRIERRPAAALDELLSFVERHPCGTVSPTMHRPLLSSVCRGPDAILDLAIDGERVLVGAVIDTCASATDGAELLVLGLDPRADREALLRRVVAEALAIGRAGPRSSLEISDEALWSQALLESLGFRVAYRSHRMEREPAPLSESPALPEGSCWSDVDGPRVAALHGCATGAYAKVPGSFVPPLDRYAAALAQHAVPSRILVRGGEVLAFVRVTPGPGDTGEISSLGRDPGQKGRGLGPVALHEGMRRLAELGARRFSLDVVAQNTTALRLYRSAGFETVSSSAVWGHPLR